jgi:signal recognition particle subunit SRP68
MRNLAKASGSSDSPIRNIQVMPNDARSLHVLLNGELQRHRALVHIAALRKKAAENSTHAPSAPLIDRLHDYPAGGVDLKNIVQFPPKLSLIPVKPIFLDIAWNYIDYPREAKESHTKSKDTVPGSQSKGDQAAQKRGWFGFGR